MKDLANGGLAGKLPNKIKKAGRIKKECESNPFLPGCPTRNDARKKAAEMKAYKQDLTKLLNSYNNRLGSLVGVNGKPSWPGKKNELFKKYAKTITNKKVIKAELNNMTKIHAEKTRRIALEKKQAAAKQRRETQEKAAAEIRAKRNAEREAAKANAKKEKENMNDRMKATRNKLAMNKTKTKDLENLFLMDLIYHHPATLSLHQGCARHSGRPHLAVK